MDAAVESISINRECERKKNENERNQRKKQLQFERKQLDSIALWQNVVVAS